MSFHSLDATFAEMPCTELAEYLQLALLSHNDMLPVRPLAKREPLRYSSGRNPIFLPAVPAIFRFFWGLELEENGSRCIDADILAAFVCLMRARAVVFHPEHKGAFDMAHDRDTDDGPH